MENREAIVRRRASVCPQSAPPPGSAADAPTIEIERYAAFCDGLSGGNPAGVVICDAFPSVEAMQRIATEIGYSETVFAEPAESGWHVRYFAPSIEIPFCGHATIALGAALAARFGNGHFQLQLNQGRAAVEGRIFEGTATAVLQSPLTSNRPVPPSYLADALALFSWSERDLDSRIPPAIVNAGANHLLLALKDAARLASMRYEFDAGRRLMNREALATISLVHAETPRTFLSRNPFASGGVYEDPATGAAAAALAGYLRELSWGHGGAITIRQGAETGMPSCLIATIPDEPGASVRVSGVVRRMWLGRRERED